MATSERFGDWYVENRARILWVSGLFNGFLLFLWLVCVSPFTYASAVTQGTIVSVRAGTRSCSYTYLYRVDGVAYTSDSGIFHLFDCPAMIPDTTRIPVTYRVDRPRSSLDGTVSANSWRVMLYALFLTIGCLAIWPILSWLGIV